MDLGPGTPSRKGRLIVICGPSGVGKSTLVGRLRREEPRIIFSVFSEESRLSDTRRERKRVRLKSEVAAKLIRLAKSHSREIDCPPA